MQGRIIAIGSLAAALMTIAGAAAFVGEKIPVPVLPDQLERTLTEKLTPLEMRLAANEALTKQQALESTELRLLQMRESAARYERAGEDVPAVITQQIRILERRVRDLDRDLQEGQ